MFFSSLNSTDSIALLLKEEPAQASNSKALSLLTFELHFAMRILRYILHPLLLENANAVHL